MVAQWERIHFLLQETSVQSPGQEDPLWRKKWQPTSVFLPGKSHGQRSVLSPPGCQGQNCLTRVAACTAVCAHSELGAVAGLLAGEDTGMSKVVAQVS